MFHRTYVTATGKLSITPALTLAEFEDSPYRLGRPGSEPDVVFQIETEKVDGPQGLTLLHRAVAVRPYSPGRPFAYHGNLVETVQRLLDEHAARHAFTGYFECRESCDDIPGDWWRLIVRGRDAVRIEPQVTWERS